MNIMHGTYNIKLMFIFYLIYFSVLDTAEYISHAFIFQMTNQKLILVCTLYLQSKAHFLFHFLFLYLSVLK